MRDINNVITGTLNAAAKTVTFNTAINKALLLTIVNVEDNIEIYTANDATNGGALNGGGTVLTLDYDTTGMSNGDLLQVIYEGVQSTALATEAEQVAGNFILDNINTASLDILLESGVTNNKLGADITTPSPAMPAGGSGVLGWLSSIWTKLNATLAVSGTVSVTGVATAANQGTELTFLSAIQAQLVSNGSVGATAVKQDTGNTSLSSIDGKVLTDTQLRATPVPVSGTITATPVKASTANTPSILTSGGDVIASNTSRKSWGVQNLGTNPLFVRMATGASSTVFHVVLMGGIANDDGTGGYFTDDTYTGVVSATGTSPRFTVTEL